MRAWWSAVRPILALVLVATLSWGLVSCSQPEGRTGRATSSKPVRQQLLEVTPPAVIQELKRDLEIHQPQVKIMSPRLNEVLQDTQVSVKLQVRDLPLFKNEDLELGPHLHFILDNQPYEAIYDVSEPIVLKDLAPGTHTIRVFASRPWHESFKNEGAYDQVTFHVFAKTPENNPNPTQALLTYSRPKGHYGAEPVMLDFYLTNAPLHLVATQDATDAIPDWQIRCTLNGQSFTFDRWEPIYLRGLKPGKNWIQLELLDENGNPLPNSYNNTVRVITYEPGGTDPLSRLVRGEIPAIEARKIIDPNYVPPAPEPEPIPELEAPESESIPEESTLEESIPEEVLPEEGSETTDLPAIDFEEPTAEEPAPLPSEEQPIEETLPQPIEAPVAPAKPAEVPTAQPAESALEEQVEDLVQPTEPVDEPISAPDQPIVPAPVSPAPLPPTELAPPSPPASQSESPRKLKRMFNQMRKALGRSKQPAADSQTPAPAVAPIEAPTSAPQIPEPSVAPVESPIPLPPPQLPRVLDISGKESEGLSPVEQPVEILPPPALPRVLEAPTF